MKLPAASCGASAQKRSGTSPKRVTRLRQDFGAVISRFLPTASVGAFARRRVKLTGIRLFTVGHSNRSFEELLALLKECEIRAIADIRRSPGSRKFLHFNRDILRPSLKQSLQLSKIINLFFYVDQTLKKS